MSIIQGFLNLTLFSLPSSKHWHPALSFTTNQSESLAVSCFLGSWLRPRHRIKLLPSPLIFKAYVSRTRNPGCILSVKPTSLKLFIQIKNKKLLHFCVSSGMLWRGYYSMLSVLVAFAMIACWLYPRIKFSLQIFIVNIIVPVYRWWT